MKIKFTAFIIFLFQIHTIGFAQQQKAYEYLSKMGEQYNNITNDTWSYVRATAHGKSAKKIEKRRAELLETIKKSTYSIKSMKPFEGDPSLKNASVEYLTLSYNVISEDYSKIVDMEAIAEESYDAMEAYILAKRIARDKLSMAFDKLDSVQIDFTKNYNIPIVEGKDETGEKLEIASEVFDYYNDVYLIFFKSYKQEAYVFEALNRNDLASFEQNKNSLLSTSQEGLKAIEEKGSYKNDPMLKIAGIKLLEFYTYEAGKPLDGISDFLYSKDKLDKISKIVESKKAAKRTQNEIDQYNVAVNEYNDNINTYNTITNKLSQKRKELLDEWNSKVETFLSKHVPK